MCPSVLLEGDLGIKSPKDSNLNLPGENPGKWSELLAEAPLPVEMVLEASQRSCASPQTAEDSSVNWEVFQRLEPLVLCEGIPHKFCSRVVSWGT